jgi:hypothetical protein
MAQGQGFWLNSENGKVIEVNRHELDIKNPEQQARLGMSYSLKSAVEELPNTDDNEDLIKIVAVRAGMVRIRDWQKFVSIQFSAKDSQKKADILYELTKLIRIAQEGKKSPDFRKLSPAAKDLALLLKTSWDLKIDNLATNRSVSITPANLIENAMKDGFLEEKLSIHDKPVKDIKYNPALIQEADKILQKHSHEDLILPLMKKQNLIQEDLTLSRVWQVANDGKHIFAMITAYRQTKNPDQDKINQQRNKNLGDALRSLGYGFTKLNGDWREIGSSQTNSTEKSYFVTVRVPEDELYLAHKSPTVRKFVTAMKNLIQGDPEQDDQIVNADDGFNQDAIAIKPNPKSKIVHLLFKDGNSVPLGEIEFFHDINKSISNLPQDTKDQLFSKIGGVAFSKLDKGNASTNKAGYFRAGKLGRGQ